MKFLILLFVFSLSLSGLRAQLPDDPTEAPMPGMEETAAAADTLGENEQRLRGTGVILETTVEYQAQDTIFHDIRNQRVYIYGNADLTYDDLHLKAAYIEIDFQTNELFAKGLPDTAGVIQGLPVFTEGMQSFQSQELRYNFETRRGRTTGVVTEEAEGFVHGDVVKIQPNREVHVADGKYTTCDHPEPHFHIEFRRAKIIPDDKIISSTAFLVIRGVPTPLFVPFGFFPNKRGQASGVLIPSYGESRERGFYLENGGFYWGISDHMDLSIRGDIYSRGSWALRAGSNYNVRYRFNGAVNLTYAVNLFGERNMPDYERSRDFRVVWSHSQAAQAHPTRSFRASVNAGSRQSSRFNPVSDEDYLSNTFSSNVSYSNRWAGRYNFSANLRHSQNTNNRRVDLSIPEITFGVTRFYPFRGSGVSGTPRWYEDINLTYNMNARNELSIADSLLFTQNALSQFRSGVRHTIPVSWATRVANHFNLSAGMNYSERWYFSTIRKEWDPHAGAGGDGALVTDTVSGFRPAREFNLASGLNTTLYGMMQFRSGPVSAFRHVLSPSLGFSFRPDFADPFWGYYETYYDPIRDEDVQYSIFEQGIYGGPPRGRSGNISLSLNNNLEMKVRNRRDPDAEDRKIVLIDNLSVTGGYDLARDSLNFSDVRVSGRTRLLGNFDITYSSTWTPYARDDQGQPIDQFLWASDRKLFQLSNTSWALNLNYHLSSSAEPRQAAGAAGFERGVDGRRTPGFGEGGNGLFEEELAELPPPGVADYSVPWNLSFTYSFNYGSRYGFINQRFERQTVQNLGVRGDIYLTPKWRVGFRTGYDFDNHQLTFTSIDVYRDLHCWEMSFNWIPMGFRQSYNFTIRVKSSVLQDLKLTRRTHHMDRAFR